MGYYIPIRVEYRQCLDIDPHRIVTYAGGMLGMEDQKESPCERNQIASGLTHEMSIIVVLDQFCGN